MTKDRLPDALDSVGIAKMLGVSVEYLVTGADGFSVSAMGRLLLGPPVTHGLSRVSRMACRGSYE